MNHCPTCGKDALTRSTSGEEKILCNLHNEGGIQEGLDILPILKEESYLKAFPEERRCRAFLEFCAEGDVGAVLDLLNDDEDEDEGGTGEEKIQPIDILRYQDQLGSMSSGLHQAISNGREEIAWLLLLLASNLELGKFPADIIQSAEMLGAKRGDQQGKVDIRNLKDAVGRTAEAFARETGGMWDSWVHSGRLKLES